MRDRIAIIKLNRPQSYNALDLEMISELARHVVAYAKNDSVHGILITGEGKAFCSGGDLSWARQFDGGLPAAFHELSSRFHQGILEIRRMRKPVVAAINGIAAGGGFSLALACDFRVMAATAVLRQGFTSNGLSMDGGGTFSLPRLIGFAKAMEILTFDKPISSSEALTLGLATRVCEPNQLLDTTMVLLNDVLKISLSSFGWSKQLLTDSFNTSFETHIQNERFALAACAAHPDGQEGIEAFLAKRPAIYNKEK